VVLILYTYKNPYKLKGNPSPIQMRQYHEKSKEGKIICKNLHLKGLVEILVIASAYGEILLILRI